MVPRGPHTKPRTSSLAFALSLLRKQVGVVVLFVSSELCGGGSSVDSERESSGELEDDCTALNPIVRSECCTTRDNQERELPDRATPAQMTPQMDRFVRMLNGEVGLGGGVPERGPARAVLLTLTSPERVSVTAVQQ